jgi:hypothetical protein
VCGGHGPRRSRVGVVAHGWNIDERASVSLVSVPASPGLLGSPSGGSVVSGGCGGTSRAGSGACRAHCWVLRSPATLVVVPGTGRSVDREPLAELVLVGRRVCAGRGRWLFENCTVDASIFEVIKMQKARVCLLVGCSRGFCSWSLRIDCSVCVEVFKGTGWMPWH